MIKTRLVTDLRPQNQNIMREGIPLDGSSHILKRLELEDIPFAAVDSTSGYHQVAITPESRDYLCIILPHGKFRYTFMPQGQAAASAATTSTPTLMKASRA